MVLVKWGAESCMNIIAINTYLVFEQAADYFNSLSCNLF